MSFLSTPNLDSSLEKDLKELTLDSYSLTIEFRKKFLTIFVDSIFKSDFSDIRTWHELDRIGKLHFTKIKIPFIFCSILLDWIQDTFNELVLGF